MSEWTTAVRLQCAPAGRCLDLPGRPRSLRRWQVQWVVVVQLRQIHSGCRPRRSCRRRQIAHVRKGDSVLLSKSISDTVKIRLDYGLVIKNPAIYRRIPRSGTAPASGIEARNKPRPQREIPAILPIANPATTPFNRARFPRQNFGFKGRYRHLALPDFVRLAILCGSGRHVVRQGSTRCAHLDMPIAMRRNRLQYSLVRGLCKRIT